MSCLRIDIIKMTSHAKMDKDKLIIVESKVEVFGTAVDVSYNLVLYGFEFGVDN